MAEPTAPVSVVAPGRLQYAFDAQRSRFTVQVFATGVLALFAHNPTLAIRAFTGTLEFAPQTIAGAALHVAIVPNSLVVTDALSARDRQEIERALRDDVLETARFADLRYDSTRITATPVAENWYRLAVQGLLQLHGVTRPHDLDAQLRIADETIRLSGDFTLRQSVYGIKPPSAMGRMILARDELKFVFDVVGRRTQS